MAGWIGAIVSGVGQFAKGQTDKQNAEFDSAMTDIQAKAAGDQAVQDENLQRRQARQVMGSLQAGLAQNGQQGPQAAQIVKQSALNAELDALNVRYQGQLRKASYMQRSEEIRQKGSADAGNDYMLAASSLISGYKDNYTGKGRFGLNK